ncbi:MAG: hypothetical protein IIU58_02480 [Clostridia bacterium]|nr:hypothetical protein [Clostridia bacterium]
MAMQDKNTRALSMIGLCKKAGRLISGVPLVCDAMREGRVYLALYAAGAAENSLKRVCDKAKSFDTPARSVDTTPEMLAKSIGKTGAVAAVGITDRGFADAIIKILGGE